MDANDAQTPDATAPDGAFLIDKPVGPTCRWLLDKLEQQLRAGALGHAGTLDPLASGLLVGLVGGARRVQDLIMGHGKVYQGEMTLGAISETLDGEGPVVSTGAAIPELSPDQWSAVTGRFLGASEQVPPNHSAVRIGGRRAHALARKGRPLEIAARTVHIEEFVMEEQEGPRVRFRVACSAGTYVRSLVRDVGEALGCGAWLSSLRRVSSGDLRVEEATPPASITLSHLVPLSRLLQPYTRWDISDEQAKDLRRGLRMPWTGPPLTEPAFAWWEGEPLFRLSATPDVVHSSRLLRHVPGLF